MVDKYPNRVGQLTPTTGTATVLSLGAVPPPFVRGLDTMFTAQGETAVVMIVDGASYQVAKVVWNANNTVTRSKSYERVEGGTYTRSTAGNAGNLSLSGGARIVAGGTVQALEDWFASAPLSTAGLWVTNPTGPMVGGADDGTQPWMHFQRTGSNATGYLVSGTANVVRREARPFGGDVILETFDGTGNGRYTMSFNGVDAWRVDGDGSVAFDRLEALTGDTVTVDDHLKVNGEARANYLRSQVNVIDAGGVWQVIPPNARGVALITGSNVSESYLISYATNSLIGNGGVQIVDAIPLTIDTSTVPTGTTGTNGKINIFSPQDGFLYIENRVSISRRVAITFLGTDSA